MYPKTCGGCGNEFETSTFSQKRCRPDCGRAPRKKMSRKLRDLFFVGVDGEGVDRPDGSHEYVMLSVGSRTLFRDGRVLTAEDIFPFLYESFLADPDAVYVGFFLGYDFIQWERSLPEHVAHALLTNAGIAARKGKKRPIPDAVVYGGWEFDVLAGRRWKLRPHTHVRSLHNQGCKNRTCTYEYAEQAIEKIRVRPGELLFDVSRSVCTGDIVTEWPDEFWSSMLPAMPHPETSRRNTGDAKWMYICDTGPFWQQSFLKVINPKAWDGHPVCSDEEYAIVLQGKADRGIVADYGTTDYFEEMARYNVLENDILARVTGRLNEGFRNEYIPIYIPAKDWYGPGRAAQLWMDNLSELLQDPAAKEHNATVRRNPELGMERVNEYGLANVDVYADMPEWAQVAAQATYYGGWFEQMVHGHVGDAYEYDINSAYPAVIANLPCLHTTGQHNGAWSRGNGDDWDRSIFGPTTLVMVHADIQGSNPFIGAMPHRDSKGRICRPNNVEGWYWLDEIEASIDAGLVDRYTVLEWVALDPCDCGNPFNPESIGIERMYNLRLEVGKNTPQGKGFKLVYNSAYGKTAQSIGAPKYSNPFYASRITSGCRIQILQAIATHPAKASAVTMVATDGIYFTSPHPHLHLSPSELGAWDETVKRNLTQLMPGVYWDESTRERIIGNLAPLLKSRGVNAADLAANIENLDSLFQDLHTAVYYGNEYEWPELSFTVGFLLDSAKSALARGKWEQAGRVQHSTTRSISSNPHTKRDITTTYVDGNLVRTRPYQHMQEPSVGYDKTFGYAEYVLSQTEGGYVSIHDGRDDMAWFRDLLAGDDVV